jgi:hypothetical protein
MMKIRACLRLPEQLDAILIDFVSKSEERLRQSMKQVPKAGQSEEELAKTLNFNWSAFASKRFPKEVQAGEIPSLFINAPKTTKKPSGTTVYSFRHPSKVEEFERYQTEVREQWRAFFRKQGGEVDEDAFFRLSGITGLKQMAGTLTASSAPEQALLSVVEEISGRIEKAPRGAEMSALPVFSPDPAIDMLLSKYVAEIYGNFASYLRGRYGEEGIAGIDAIISLLDSARAEYLNRTLSHLTGIQSKPQVIANPTQITVAQVRDFLAGKERLPRSEAEALAKRLSEHFGEEQGLSSPDVSFLQVYLLDVIPSSPNAMRGIGQAEGLQHIRASIYRAWRISHSDPARREKVSRIMEDLFNKRIPSDTPEPLRRWLQQHGWQEVKPQAAPKAAEEAVEAVEEAAPAPSATPATPATEEPAAPAIRTLPSFPSVEAWDSGAVVLRHKQVEKIYASKLENPQLSQTEYRQRKAVLDFVQGVQQSAASPEDFFRQLPSLFGRLLAESITAEVERLFDGGVFAQLLKDLREVVLEGQRAHLLSKRNADEVVSIIDFYLHHLPEKSLDPTTVLPAVEEIAGEIRPQRVVLRAGEFPSADEWTREGAYEAVSGFGRAIANKAPHNEAVIFLTRLFTLREIPTTATQHFHDLLGVLRAVKGELTGFFGDRLRRELEDLSPAIREGLAEWFLSVRRFAEGMVGKEGVSQGEVDEFVGIVDDFVAFLRGAEPTPAPSAPATAVEEAERVWEQAQVGAVRVEEFPSFEEWTPQRANGAMVELEKALSEAGRNRAATVLKQVFATPTTANTSSKHFQELLEKLRKSERVLSQAVFREDLVALPPALRQAATDWLLSLRRFGEGIAGQRGISEAESAEFVRIIDDYLAALKEAEPAPSAPALTAPTSAVDEAIEQMAEPAPTAPTPSEPTPAPPAEEAVPAPARRKRGKKAKGEVAEAGAEEPAPTAPAPEETAPSAPAEAEPPSPPAAPPPTVASEPIELPQGIEFARFPDTLSKIMQEYGTPTIRSGKQEFAKMEQIIAHYFGTNGAFSSIQDAVLEALNEMVSAGGVNFWSGIKRNTRLLDIENGRVVFRPDYEARLQSAIAELRQAEPLLHFIDDDHLAGFILLEDAIKALAVSAGEEAFEALPYIRHFLAFRLLNPERLQHLPDIISALAGSMKQAGEQTARAAVQDIEVFLRQRVGEEWFQEVEGRLKDIFATGVLARLIYAYFRKAPVLYYGNGRLTEGEWTSWNDFTKRQFVKTLLTDEQAWQSFRANFANPTEVDKLREGVLTTPVVRHPYILHGLLTYAQEAGFDLPALVAAADVFRRHIDAMRDIYFKSGIPPSTLASIDDFGVNGYRAWLTELRTALQKQGLEDADRALEQALEAVKEIDDDLLGFEVLKTILGFSNDLDGLPALKQTMNNLANVMFALHGFYKRAVVANIGEELLPVLRAFQDEGLIGEVIVPEPTVFSGRSLRKALKEEYGAVDADTAFRYLVDGLPPSVRSIYYTAQTAGKEAEFDLFIPSFVADLIAQPDFLRTRQVWDTLNNIFKSSVIVYNPPALIRNAFTNTLLLWYIGGGNIFRQAARRVQPYGQILRPLEVGLEEAFRLQREAVGELKSGAKLARDLENIDPSLSLLRTYERLPEWEVINSTDSRAVRGFRWVSNRALLRSAHYFQTMSEAAAKYAAVKELLRRWGKLENYTVEDLIKAVAETNAWLINYRVVPPAVQFMRKYLGLFPFITFHLNTLINFARHPERFYTDLLRGGVYMERLHNIFYFLANDPLTTRHDIRGEEKTLFKLFPDYMRHNPLLIVVPDDRGDVWAMDLTYWLPIGVFETQFDPHPLFGEAPVPLPQLATIGWMTDYKDLVRYFGGAIRPLAEAILNKNLLTGQPIYDEELPELEKARAVGGYLIGQIPFVRWLLGMGFGAREVNPIGRTRSADTLLQRGTALMGIRAFHIDALQEARIKELQGKMNDINRTLVSLANNPTLSPQRKAELARMYQEKLFDLQQQLEEQYLVWVPLVVRLDGKTPIFINTPAEFRAVMSNLQAKRRLETREQFFREAYPAPVPPALPPFEEEIGAGATEEEE